MDPILQVLAFVIALITASSLVWVKLLKPVVDIFRRAGAWMDRIEVAIKLVEAHMKPNSGSTLIDKVAAAGAAAEAAAIQSNENSAGIKILNEKVTTLLAHDRERDQPGLRYGTDNERDTE